MSGAAHCRHLVVMALLVSARSASRFYVRHAGRVAHPIIDLALLKIPTYAAASIGGFLFRMGLGALPFLLPLMLQVGFGLSALNSGLLTFASAAGAMTMKTTAVRDHPHPGLSRRAGRRRGDQRRVSVRLQPVPAGHPASGDFSGAAGRRLFPLAADDQHQHLELCRRAAGDAEPRHEPDQHGPATVADRRRRHRRADAAHGADPARRRRPGGAPISTRPLSGSR